MNSLNTPTVSPTITPAISEEAWKEAERRINANMVTYSYECKSAHADAMNRARDARMGPQ